MKTKKRNYLRSYIPINRTKKNIKNKCSYLTTRNKPLSDTINGRINNIYIPPAYTNIFLAKSSNNKVQVIGEDIAGRKQYIYHPKYVSQIEKRKYNKLSGLGKNIIFIEKENNKQINNLIQNLLNKKSYNITKTDLLHVINYMLLNYHFRIGNKKYANKYNSYGISTLKPEHCKLIHNKSRGEKPQYHISFNGKKGIINKTIETNPKIIKLITFLKNRCNKIKCKYTDCKYLFNYEYTNPISKRNDIALLTSNDIQNYYRNTYKLTITPKMFRTWYANYHMLIFLYNFNNCKNCINNLNKPKHLSKILKREIGNYVSNKLNNTPAICRSKYINNKLINDIIKNPKYHLKKIKHNIPNLNTSIHTHMYLNKLLIK